MSTEAQYEAQLEAVHAAVSVGINALRAFLASGNSLNLFNVSNYIRENNIQNKYVQRFVRDVSHMKNKPETFSTLADTLEHIENLKDVLTMEQVNDALSLLVGATH